MDINFDYLAMVQVFSTHNTETGKVNVTEVLTKLDARGDIFKAWYDKEMSPTSTGQSAQIDAFCLGLAMSIRFMCHLTGGDLNTLTEKAIGRIRAIIETSVQEEGSTDKQIGYPEPPPSPSKN